MSVPAAVLVINTDGSSGRSADSSEGTVPVTVTVTATDDAGLSTSVSDSLTLIDCT